MAEAVVKTLEIRLIRSRIGVPKKQKRTLEALGLRKINQRVQKKDHPSTQGMIQKIGHLVEVEEILKAPQDQKKKVSKTKSSGEKS